MPIEFKCESCGVELSVSDDSAGIRGECAGCGRVVIPPGGGYDLGEPVVLGRPRPKPLPTPEPLAPVGKVPSSLPSTLRWIAAGLGIILATSILGGYLGARYARSREPDPWTFPEGALVAQAERPVRPKVIAPRPGASFRDLINQTPSAPPTPAAPRIDSGMWSVAPPVRSVAANADRRSDDPAIRAPGRGDPPPTEVGPPPVLVPDLSYQPKVGDEACVLRDRTPGTTTWEGSDKYVRKELAGDEAGAAAAVRSGAVTMLPRGATFTVVEVREVAPRPKLPASGEFDPSHPAGAVVSCKFLDGPADGRVLFLARADVGRLTPVPADSPRAVGLAGATVRTPRKPRPADRASRAAAAITEADAIVSKGRALEALRAYRAIVADYPDTPQAAKAKANVEVLEKTTKR